MVGMGAVAMAAVGMGVGEATEPPRASFGMKYLLYSQCFGLF